MKDEATAGIGIVGAGALGSYFGIRLAAAGNPVRFLLRSDYESVKADGMQLVLHDGTGIQLDNPDVFDSAEGMGPVDHVIIGLKTTRNNLLKELLAPVVGPRTTLITIQNGLGNVQALETLYPENPVIVALCQIGVCREAAGKIRSFVPQDGFVLLGGNDKIPDEQLTGFMETLKQAGINARTTASLGEALWRKLMWNVPFNGLTVAIGGKPTNAICEDEGLRAIARGLMEEIRLAGNALGYPIEPEYTDKLLGFTDKLGPYMASSVHDWLNGRRVEVDAIFRKPLEAGRSVGVAMPHLATLTGILDGLGTRH
jgi:2-dehydropantoate 2-reductase